MLVLVGFGGYSFGRIVVVDAETCLDWRGIPQPWQLLREHPQKHLGQRRQEGAAQVRLKQGVGLVGGKPFSRGSALAENFGVNLGGSPRPRLRLRPRTLPPSSRVAAPPIRKSEGIMKFIHRTQITCDFAHKWPQMGFGVVHAYIKLFLGIIIRSKLVVAEPRRGFVNSRTHGIFRLWVVAASDSGWRSTGRWRSSSGAGSEGSSWRTGRGALAGLGEGRRRRR